MSKGKNVLTTGDVAKICNVAPRTVSKWFDNGQLKGYRIPGSKDRRIPLDELLKFMKENNMPTTLLTVGVIRVLIVSDSADELVEKLKKRTDYEIKTAQSSFETGLIAQKFIPHVLLINLLAPNIDVTEICSIVHSSEDLQATKIIALANQLSESEAAALIRKGFDDYICDSHNLDEVIRKIEEATSIIY